MNDKAKSVVNYYVLCNKLKYIIRSGWKKWNVKRERLESIAEHIYGVQSLAIAMYSEYEYKIDIYKVIVMLAVHELEETVIGDLTWYDTNESDKLENGHNAVSKILSNLLSGEEIKNLIFEFDERKTAEALFAYHCDKLECDIQCKIYDEENCVDMSAEHDNPIYKSEQVQNVIRSGENSWSGMWLEFDRSKFVDDGNFVDVLNYVKNNKIFKKF